MNAPVSLEKVGTFRRVFGFSAILRYFSQYLQTQNCPFSVLVSLFGDAGLKTRAMIHPPKTISGCKRYV